VIRYLDETRGRQPGLARMASHFNWSPSQCSRLLFDWAGVEPETFLQSLTRERIRDRLSEGARVLDQADVCADSCQDIGIVVVSDALSVIDDGSLYAGFVETPFGDCLLAGSPSGICYLAFVESRKESWAELQVRWPTADFKRDDQSAVRWSERIFNRSSRLDAPLKVYVTGTEFQVQVWRALLRVPHGMLVSYGQLAAAAGRPAAVRAVGTAVGKNPIAYLIPCHRVIRQTGEIGGYRWGSVRKRAIQVWEDLVPDR
jgi:AraC family transcriptional regulator of adaptative response/methylated-DNA-[protein]-cysteine methyltransferase